ncbi:MAG: hypothetical protein KJT03_09145, partial [Verrucomicrobiae bacterium]|nr:hypothetical protein [Verrucomicrobiae bacterium]
MTEKIPDPPIVLAQSPASVVVRHDYQQIGSGVGTQKAANQDETHPGNQTDGMKKSLNRSTHQISTKHKLGQISSAKP